MDSKTKKKLNSTITVKLSEIQGKVLTNLRDKKHALYEVKNSKGEKRSVSVAVEQWQNDKSIWLYTVKIGKWDKKPPHKLIILHNFNWTVYENIVEEVKAEFMKKLNS